MIYTVKIHILVVNYFIAFHSDQILPNYLTVLIHIVKLVLTLLSVNSEHLKSQQKEIFTVYRCSDDINVCFLVSVDLL